MPIYQEILKRISTIEKKIATNNLVNSVDDDAKDELDLESSDIDVTDPSGK